MDDSTGVPDVEVEVGCTDGSVVDVDGSTGVSDVEVGVTEGSEVVVEGWIGGSEVVVDSIGGCEVVVVVDD